MQIDAIASELKTFIRRRFAVPEEDRDFTDTVDLFNYGYIDSLGAAELTTFIEGRFAIKFSDSDWISFPLNTVQGIASFVSKRQLGEI